MLLDGLAAGQHAHPPTAIGECLLRVGHSDDGVSVSGVHNLSLLTVCARATLPGRSIFLVGHVQGGWNYREPLHARLLR